MRCVSNRRISDRVTSNVDGLNPQASKPTLLRWIAPRYGSQFLRETIFACG